MEQKLKSPAEQLTDLLDVHVLDVVAEIEALLRGIREVQREVLRLRGVSLPGSGDGDTPVATIQGRLGVMLEECDTLRDAVEQATDTARELSSHY